MPTFETLPRFTTDPQHLTPAQHRRFRRVVVGTFVPNQRSPGRLAATLAGDFWADLEQHHPGIDSIRLSPDTAAAWKTRLATKTARRRQSDGSVITVTEPRTSAPAVKMTVRRSTSTSASGP
ncbi:hypothetical protein ACGFX2_15540 [Streptomyces goshikiensis]|uniref:hypothetical protein n=1 Tax=Streptomyces goshikiensis TaxID=1942 RepID=UPI00371F105B